MYIPKRYGESKSDSCPFCGKQATSVNAQKIPVCIDHKSSVLQDMKCACGSWLDLRTGKFGPYFSCMKCGNINFRKAFEMNQENNFYKSNNSVNNSNKSKQIKVEVIGEYKPSSPKVIERKDGKKEYVIDSNDVEFM